MADLHRTHVIRCPIYGFVTLDEWERDIIDQPAFQRLRRIRQLALSEYVYPGATHTRFEHSLGVMNMAAMLFDSIVANSKSILASELGYKDGGLDRHKRFVRLAALLHDVGHGPYSHAGDDLYPFHSTGNKSYRHEDYSAAIIRTELADVIDNHPVNRTNWEVKAHDIAALIDGTSNAGSYLFWKDLISGQVDADRMDYLLRDSHHAGVAYGNYDWQRLVHSVRVIPSKGSAAPRLGIHEGGWHAAEALILARYFMFTQVYFHKTRVAFDIHLRGALANLLPGGKYPPPVGRRLKEFLKIDDATILAKIKMGGGGEHGDRILRRDHFREIWSTPETPSEKDLRDLSKARNDIGKILAAEERAEKSWYKSGVTDVQVLGENLKTSIPLSKLSSIVKNIRPVKKVSLFVRSGDKDAARGRLARTRR